MVLREVIQCILADLKMFGKKCCLHIKCKQRQDGDRQFLQNICIYLKSTRRHIPEDCILMFLIHSSEEQMCY